MRIAATLFVVASCAFEPGTLPSDDFGGGGGGMNPDDDDGVDAGGGSGAGTGSDSGMPSIARSCKFMEADLRLCLELEDRQYDPKLIDGSPSALDSMATSVGTGSRSTNNRAGTFASGSSIQVPESAQLDVTAFTIEMWAWQPLPQSAELLSNVQQYYIQLAGDGRITCMMPNAQVTSGDNVDVFDWTHIACTFANGTMKVYVDGALTAQGNFPNAAPQSVGTTGTRIGGTFSGALDDVRIYARALPGADICKHAGRTTCGPDGGQSGPGG